MKRLAILCTLLAAGCSVKAAPPVLTVCADPNNLPFSNRARQGFENRIADIIAREMHRPVRYVWWAQRRGYVRNTLGEQKCDIWPGVASGVEMVATTRPYYRSTYVFVTRADRNLKGLTLDDPRLKKLTIGIQMVGDDAMNTPPAHALAARGMTKNVRGFRLYGDYAKPNPPADIIRAVADGKVDMALAWGPLAGYFAKSSPVPLRIERVTPWLDNAQWPMVYDISMGVRKNDPAFQQQIETILARRKTEISALLDRYGVPRVD